MPSFDEFRAWVKIGDTVAEEYGTTVQGNRVTCYIASEIGKEFGVYWDDSEVMTPTRGVASIDGQSYPPRYIESKKRNRATLTGVRDSETTTRPFVFSKINLTDDDAYLESNNTRLGEIEVVIHSVDYSRRHRQHRNGSRNITQTEIPTTFHEKHKKGFDHQANFGPSRQISQIASHNHSRPSFEKPRGMPIVVFCFKYRPMDILQAHRIIPLPRRALPPPKKEKIEVIDVDEEEEEIQYMGMRIYMTIEDEEEIDLTRVDVVKRETTPVLVVKPPPPKEEEESLFPLAYRYREEEEEEELEQNFKIEPLPDDIRAQMDFYAYRSRVSS